MKIIIIPAPFKECASSRTISRLITKSILKFAPNSEIVWIELSDGGTGFAQWLVELTDGSYRNVFVKRSDGIEILAKLGIIGDDSAVVEISQMLGLALVPPKKRKPLSFSSYGAGQMIIQALSLGYHNILIGCGDSSVCDAGIGAAYALGYRFFDKKGKQLEPITSNIDVITKIDDSTVSSGVKSLNITIVCNTKYAWTGKHGAIRLFGAQKGLTSKQINKLDQSYAKLAQTLSTNWRDPRNIEGAGASGGISGTLSSLLGASIMSYKLFQEKYVNLEDLISDAELVVTGEGTLDQQTFLGKLPAYVAELSAKHNVPCIAIVGYKEQLGDLDKIFSKVLVLSEARSRSHLEYSKNLSLIDSKIKEFFRESIYE
jgi:glycerate kinase